MTDTYYLVIKFYINMTFVMILDKQFKAQEEIK